MNTLSQGALSLLPGGMQEFSKLFCFLLRMPLYNSGWGETERASHALLLTNSSRTIWCPVTTVAYSRTGAWELAGLFQAQSLLGSWLDAILEQPFSSAVFSLQKEDLCPGVLASSGWGIARASADWCWGNCHPCSEEGVRSTARRTCCSGALCSHLGHPLLETEELKIAQSFPWCPLVISVYGL